MVIDRFRVAIIAKIGQKMAKRSCCFELCTHTHTQSKQRRFSLIVSLYLYPNTKHWNDDVSRLVFCWEAQLYTAYLTAPLMHPFMYWGHFTNCSLKEVTVCVTFSTAPTGFCCSESVSKTLTAQICQCLRLQICVHMYITEPIITHNNKCSLTFLVLSVLGSLLH